MEHFRRSRSTASFIDDATPTFSIGIEVWYDPGEEADADIVFVHGLTGDRERTWTHQSKSEPWPKIFLPPHLSYSRILTFGYDAYVLKRSVAATNQLVDHSTDFLSALTSLRDVTESATRPLIFIGHSLGGLVCKDAILQSRNSAEPHLRNVFQSTKAIAFLGTPHRGSDLAKWAKIPAKTLGVLKSTNTDLLSVLQTSSEVLRRISNDFLSMVRDLRERNQVLNITCFWESLPMPYVGTIVEKESASLAGYNAISIHANHRDMVRFVAPEDPGFVSVLSELKRWIRDLERAPQANMTADVSPKEPKQERIDCLQSLNFPESGLRQSNIDEPNPQTCEWIFHDYRYRRWNTLSNRTESRNLLWIKGKPGSGKSTMMKRIMQQYDKNSSTDGIICLSFFFNARGMQIENSPLGLYRTLLFQLLQSSQTLLDEFLPQFLQKEKQCYGQKVAWRTPELSEFFHSAICKLQSNSIYIFIDALDECEEDEVRAIIKRFENTSVAAGSSGTRIKICWSSRHYPHISLRVVSGFEVIMEDHNGSDIRRYVRQELDFQEQNLRTELINGILSKSAGIFFWASFMVRRLSKAFDQGFSAEQMRALLDKVPPSLEGLFEEVLRSMESDRRTSITTLAPWVICTLRPLEPFELYVALEFSAAQPPSLFFDSKFWTDFDLERFQKYLLDVSGGLFETVLIDGGRRVQVIHESVREFFLKLKTTAKILELPLGKPFLEYAHEEITAACDKFFRVEEFRRSLPIPEKDGFIAAEKLASMLYRPIESSFDILRFDRVTYFHDFVFVHLNEKLRSKNASSEDRDELALKSRTVFEGWLVFLYFLIIHTGALSPRQRETLSLFRTDPSMIGFSTSQFLRIASCINNLVVFVNKAMKDGFELKSPSPRRDIGDIVTMDESVYLRLFYLRSVGSLQFKNMVHRSSDFDGPWEEYPGIVRPMRYSFLEALKSYLGIV